MVQHHRKAQGPEPTNVYRVATSRPSGSYASSAELSRCSSRLSEEDYGVEYRERDPYDENDSYHSCHSSVSYSKGSPDWDPDETQGAYSDEGGYSKDGGEEAALYEEEDDGGLYEGEEEGLYEDEEVIYNDEDMYILDGTLSEDMEAPFTPTPTSTAPQTLDVPSSRPPLEKQPSLHQQQPPTQPPNQTSNQSHPPGMAPSAQPPSVQPTQPPKQPPSGQPTQPPKQPPSGQPTQPPRQAPTQPQPAPSAPSATSFFSMANPLTAAVTGLASTFLSSVPTAQPAQTHPPAPAVSQQHQAASVVPTSHPATGTNSQPPTSTTGPSSQQTPFSGQPQSHLNGPAATQSAAPEDQDLQLEEEPWPEEEMMFDKEARTPPAKPEETLPKEEIEEEFEESRPATPEEEEEMLPESPPVIEEPKELVDPAVRAKQNWLRIYNKVLEQVREVGPYVCRNERHTTTPMYSDEKFLSVSFGTAPPEYRKLMSPLKEADYDHDEIDLQIWP
ncbi:proteoglycan 4-like [Notothenia coriiceps]|uniref:Proteoglycan 4-like n=1 Tax=Notothenia coriiceps TaxID=8208 RepID=A0A6I9PNI1_9TELE|nr:PREDICTED: proteoglycan 4-like [Notothenia coriiceps]